ncbi:MAG TPA: glycosyltransferase [Roseomonas sp.]
MAGCGTARFDVDFSLAVHSRTGKYFIGRDLIEAAGDFIGRTYFWIMPRQDPPSGLLGSVIGRLQYLQARGQVLGGPLAWLPRRISSRPLLHLDPFTVLTARLRRSDAVLCHDVGPLTHPDLFDAEICGAYRKIYDEIAEVGPHMIFVSRSSQRAFEQALPGARLASSRVIYPAIRADVAARDTAPVPGIDGPFLLSVGSIGARKNQRLSIAAFGRSGLAARGVRYVVCGGREPGYEAAAEAAARTPGVLLLPYITDAQLRWLYGQAQGFVLASLLEGFGVPVAEAISRGLVPAVSRDSVLHEVAGDGALLVDPEDEADIAAAMVALIDMEATERAARLAQLREAIQRFTPARFKAGWGQAFAEMLDRGRLALPAAMLAA